MLSVYGCKALSSLNRFDFSANTHALTVPKHPPVPVSHDVTGLLSFSQTVSFRFVFGLPAEALPPSAAIRLRSSTLSFLLRASPALRAISERRSGLNFSVLALPPSFPRARACGFLCFIELTLAKRHVCVKQNVSPSTADGPILYCAEPFANQNSTAELILKAMKRAMAGEYSRELSAKVKTGQLRLVRLGYKMGGFPPYGMRRMLLDTHGTPKQLLADFERKSLTTERVILVPGPAEEIAVVQRIFREYADEQRSLTNIARNLNNEGIAFVQGGKWTTNTVAHALDRTQYMGTHVWGRTTAYLSSRPKKVSPEQWGVCPSAFQPVISGELFERAQKRLTNITYRVPNEKLLERLRSILKEHGKLTSRIIQRSRLCPGVDTYVRRFGGL